MTIDPQLVRLQEERELALNDLRQLETELAAGEVTPDVAAELRSRYEVTAADAIAAIEAYSPEPNSTRSGKRIVAGVAIFAAAATAITITLSAAVEPRPEGGFVTGGVARDVAEDASLDLSTVTNEEMETVVAANPDIFAMRLALARRYVEAGEFSNALGHYMYVLERETDPEALMYVGWMTYLSGDATTGAGLLEESLAIRPDHPLAQWFLANVLFHGTEDPQNAEPLLQAVIDSETAPAEIVEEAQRMLQELST